MFIYNKGIRNALIVHTLLLTIPAIGRAQGLGNAPYSALGIGEPYGQANVANMGMGGLGISNVNPFTLNSQNPALLARRQRLTIFEVGTLGQLKNIAQNVGEAGQPQAQRDFGVNLSYLALAVPLSSRWNAALSLRPYSYVDYRTRQFSRVPGTIYEAEYSYRGRGGINRAAFSHGVRLFTNLYLGVEASFLFGNVTNSSESRVLINQNPNTTEPADIQVARTSRTNYSDVIWKVGAAWRPKLSDKWSLNLGATFDPQTRLRVRETETFQQLGVVGPNAGQPLSAPDTIRNSERAAFTLPQQLQLGISLERNNQFVVGVDAGFTPWSQFRTSTNQPGNLGNSFTVATGVEFTPRPNSTRYWDLVGYRAGFNYTRTPYVVDSRQPNDLSVSAGISLPVGAYYVNYLNLSVVAGQRGALSGQQIREQYLRFALGVSFNDLWFRKQAVD